MGNMGLQKYKKRVAESEEKKKVAQSNGITASVVYITPEMAREWLKKNEINRRVSNQKVYNYAKDMEQGKWQLNGEPICFRKDGSLANGQHRLIAISRQTRAIPMMVIWGIDDDVNIYDRGRNRGLADTIGIPNDVISIARGCLLMKGNTVASDGEVENFVNKHAKIIEKVFEVVPRVHKKGSTSRIHSNAMYDTAVFFALKSGVEGRLITEFWRVFSSGYVDKASNDPSPCLTLRNDLLEKKIKPVGSGESRKQAIYAIEKAVFDYANNKSRHKTYSKQDTPTYSENVEI